MICPTCKGSKMISVPFSRNGPTLSCPDCKATGIVDDRYPQWKIAGALLKEERLAQRETLRQFCKRVGILCLLRSEQERGFACPPVSQSESE